MLKYTDIQITFAEVPDEITLCINLSNCPCHCKGCHSPQLAEDIGCELDTQTLSSLIDCFNSITCVSFMGGDSDPNEVRRLAKFVKENYDLKTAWYSGRETAFINLDSFDFIKLGPYKEECGPLNKETTNQVFYRVIHLKSGKNRLFDITYKFWKEYD